MQSINTYKKNRNVLNISILCLFVLVAVELIDIMIGNVSDFQYDEKYSFLKFFLSTQTANLFYIILTSIFIAIQFPFLYSTKVSRRKKNKIDKLLYTITVFLHIVLIAIILIMVTSMIVFHSYPFILSKISVGISFTLASIIFIILANKFLNWYRKSSNKILLIFLFAFLFLAFTKINFELGIFSVRYDYNGTVTANTIVEFPDMTGNSILTFVFRDIYWVFASISFVALWIGTILLVNKYKEVIGLKKYYTIIVMSIVLFIPTPIGYYLSISEIGNFVDPVLFFSLTSINSTIGAVLFFVTFWIFSKNIDQKELSKYLLLTGIGMFLYFVSDQATIEQHAYPPYSIISITMLGYSAFLTYEGLLSSAILLSKDDQLRKFVYSQLKEKFLYNISLGELYGSSERVVADKVLRKNIDLMTPVISSEQLDTKKVIGDIINSIIEIKEEMDEKKGYFILNLNCVKCHKLYNISVPHKSKKTEKDETMKYPQSENFICTECGNTINLWNTQQKVQPF